MEKQKPQVGTDAIRINIEDGMELKFWAEKLGVSRDEIKTAVKQVGDSLTAVKRYIIQVQHA
jgi:hypothetical protein